MILQDIIDEANTEFERALMELPHVRADKLGLDSRCGFVYVSEQESLIIAEGSNVRSLDYYGGFEYVNEEARQSFGRWTLYYGDECERVQSALNRFLGREDDNMWED